MTSYGDNDFNPFPENRLSKFRAVYTVTPQIVGGFAIVSPRYLLREYKGKRVPRPSVVSYGIDAPESPALCYRTPGSVN